MNDNHEGHDDLEDHKGPPRLRVASPLSAEAESVMSQTIAAAIAVHRALGPGFVESIYKKAMCIELDRVPLLREGLRRVVV